MKKILLLIFIFAVLASCNQKDKPKIETEKSVITVSILPQKTFVEKIAGNDFKINVLIPTGANPSAYTLLPSQLKDIVNSIVWFRIGYIGFEYSWKDKISEVNKKMKVYDLSEGLNLISGNSEQHEEHVHTGGIDPHIWLSPELVKKMAKKIRDILSELNPVGAEKYMNGYLDFIKEIDQANVEIKKTLLGYEGKTFIVFHPSLTYFAQEYGLNQISLESGGKESTLQHIKQVVDLAKKENIRVIYIQTEFDREHARIFAEEIKGRIIQVSPLDPDWSNNIVSMAQTMRDNF